MIQIKYAGWIFYILILLQIGKRIIPHLHIIVCISQQLFCQINMVVDLQHPQQCIGNILIVVAVIYILQCFTHFWDAFTYSGSMKQLP